MNFVLPIAAGVFALAELVSWLRGKPPLSGVAPTEPGTSLTAFALKSAPAPAVPRVWTGASAAVELRSGDQVAIWTRVEPMTPNRLAEIGAVTLAVQLKSATTTSPMIACPMHKPGGVAWTELGGGDASADVCLRTATECVLTAPAAGSYTIEASVEWLEGRDMPTAAALEPFVRRAP